MTYVRVFWAASLAIALVGCGGGRDRAPGTGMTAPDGGTTAEDGGTMHEHDAGRGPVDPQPPGSSCTCDDECAADGDHPGVCIFGVCMTRASGDCATAGSTTECGAGSRCWGLDGVDFAICWPDCATYACAGTCDGDGSCAPTSDTVCDPACGSVCGAGPCGPDNPTGLCASETQACVDGACVEACSASNPAGYCPAGSSCTEGTCVSTSGCPTWMCVGPTCSNIVAMPGSYDRRSPEAQAAGYYIATEPRYAFLRQDLTQLVQHAACEVATRFPGTQPIGLSDLSQADGRTPGSDVGDLRHPDGTHTGGDMDLAYYQTDGSNNPQIICGDGTDNNYNGRPGRFNDGYFCTTDANIIDWPRQAYWFAMLASSPLVRVFGIDETLADDFEREVNTLLSSGAITREQASRALRLGYGNAGGWAFHHHHTHNSYNWP